MALALARGGVTASAVEAMRLPLSELLAWSVHLEIEYRDAKRDSPNPMPHLK